MVWLWIAIEPIEKVILDMHISFERSILVAKRFLQELIRKYGKYPVSTDGGTWYPSQACKFLKLKHHTHSSYEKSIIERTIQYIKDRTESLMMTISRLKKITINYNTLKIGLICL